MESRTSVRHVKFCILNLLRTKNKSCWLNNVVSKEIEHRWNCLTVSIR